MILAVVVVALVWAFFRGGSALMRILAVTGMVAGIAYVFTPLTASGSLGDPSGFDANLRYVAPVLMVGFLLLPLIPWIRHGSRPWILIGAVHDPARSRARSRRRTGSSSTTSPRSGWRS